MKSKASLLVLLLMTCALWAQEGQPAPQPPAQGGAMQGPGGPGGRRGGFMRMRGAGTSGTITAINSDSISITTMDGAAATVKLADATQYRRDGQPAKLSDFKVGDRIMVRGTAAGDNTWVAEMIGANPNMEARMREGLGKEFIAGKVKSIDGTKLTITRVDGQDQTIEVDENTSFRKQRDSITLADIKVGDQVMGRGALKNGVFVPSTLSVGPMRMRMGEGGPRGQRPPQ